MQHETLAVAVVGINIDITNTDKKQCQRTGHTRSAISGRTRYMRSIHGKPRTRSCSCMTCIWATAVARRTPRPCATERGEVTCGLASLPWIYTTQVALDGILRSDCVVPKRIDALYSTFNQRELGITKFEVFVENTSIIAWWRSFHMNGRFWTSSKRSAQKNKNGRVVSETFWNETSFPFLSDKHKSWILKCKLCCECARIRKIERFQSPMPKICMFRAVPLVVRVGAPTIVLTRECRRGRSWAQCLIYGGKFWATWLVAAISDDATIIVTPSVKYRFWLFQNSRPSLTPLHTPPSHLTSHSSQISATPYILRELSKLMYIGPFDFQNFTAAPPTRTFVISLCKSQTLWDECPSIQNREILPATPNPKLSKH